MNLILILIGAMLVNNFVLNKFMGICPFLGVSKKTETAFGMGMAVTFVITVASLVTYFVRQLLVRFGLEYLQTIAFILVIAGFGAGRGIGAAEDELLAVSGTGRLPSPDHHQLRGSGRDDSKRG